MLRLLALAAVLSSALAFCPTLLSESDACSCFAYTDGAVIKCTGNDGPALVEKLKAFPMTIRELTIESANIVEIGPRAFRNLAIKNLRLDYNRIKMIHPDAFRGLERTLMSLSLTHNKLTEVPTDALTGMEALTVLNLQCNNIGDIFGSVFRNVSSLIELNLACNQICQIRGPAFEETAETLQSLILDKNCLTEIPNEALEGFSRLLALHLQHNNIANASATALGNMTNLLMLKLGGNAIETLDEESFVDIPNLRYLYLDQNDIFNLPPGYFQKFPKLEILDLSYNQIAELPPNAFRGMETLMQLKLQGNSIRDIGPQAFAKTPLLLLLLSDNCLTSISRTMFQGVPFLRQLSLSGNTVSQVQPYSFSQLPSLHILDLARNNLPAMDPSTLIASSHVTVLLQENPLVCSQQGFHIVQGGQPILLLSEENKVCSGPNGTAVVAQCPTVRPKPAAPECCVAFQATTAVPLQTTTAQPAQVYSTVDPPARRAGGRQRKVFTVSPPPALFSTPVPGVSPRINMDRFWRLQDKSSILSRRPTEDSASIRSRIRARPTVAPVVVEEEALPAILPVRRRVQEAIQAGQPRRMPQEVGQELPAAVIGIPRVPIPNSRSPATAFDTQLPIDAADPNQINPPPSIDVADIRRPQAPVPGSTLNIANEFRLSPSTPVLDAQGKPVPVEAGSQEITEEDPVRTLLSSPTITAPPELSAPAPVAAGSEEFPAAPSPGVAPTGFPSIRPVAPSTPLELPPPQTVSAVPVERLPVFREQETVQALPLPIQVPGGQFQGQPQNQQFPGQPQIPQFQEQPQNQQFPGQPQNQQFSGQSQNQQFPGQPQDQQFPGQPQTQQFQEQPQNQQFQGQPGQPENQKFQPPPQVPIGQSQRFQPRPAGQAPISQQQQFRPPNQQQRIVPGGQQQAPINRRIVPGSGQPTGQQTQPRLLPPGISNTELNPFFRNQAVEAVGTVPSVDVDPMAPDFIADSGVMLNEEDNVPDWVPEEFAGFEQLPPWMQERLNRLEISGGAGSTPSVGEQVGTVAPVPLPTKAPVPTGIDNLPLKPSFPSSPAVAGTKDFAQGKRPKVEFSMDAETGEVVQAASEIRVEGDFA